MDTEIFKLPPLTSALLKSIIFSMENQVTIGYLDMISGEVVEVSNINESVVVKEFIGSKNLISLTIKDNKDRFLLLPPWGSIEGFKIREHFIKDVKNPIYKTKLNHVFHTGRGVFRKFKQVLKENPIIERQWLEYKSNYMKAIVINWYKECEGYIKLINLEDEVEELPNDLLISDFIFSTNIESSDKEVINKLKRDFTKDLDKIENLIISRRQALLKNPRYVVAYNLGNEVIGFIEWEAVDDKLVEITCYGVVKLYRGLGIFSLLFDKLMRQTNRERFEKVLTFSTKRFKGLNKYKESCNFSCNFNYSLVDLNNWNQNNDSSELMEV
jgi:hypothetical protein